VNLGALLSDARLRQPDKVIFFVEDFVAEPDMALRGPTRGPGGGFSFEPTRGSNQSLGDKTPAYVWFF